MSSEQTPDADDEVRHPEEQRNGDRVIAINSQPQRIEQDGPPQHKRSLGAVSGHAVGPVSGDGQPRRSGSRGRPIVSMLLMAVPLAGAAYGIRFLEGRTTILAVTAALGVVWLVGLVAAWRGLGPSSARSNSGVWLGRAIGLVLGAVAAVYLLLDTVTPLL